MPTYYKYPSGAHLTTVSSSASANTKGAYAEVAASTAADSSRITVGMGVSGATRFHLIDVATGAAAAETVRIANLAIGHAGAECYKLCQISVDVNIPSGTRIAARCQSNGSSLAESVWILLESRGLTSATDPATYGAVTASSRGTLVDPGGTANTKGSYAELSSSTSADHSNVAIFCTLQAASETVAADQAWKLDLAIGAAAAEVVVIPDLDLVVDVEGDVVEPRVHQLQCLVGASTRLAARAECDVNTANDRVLAVTVLAMESLVPAQKVTQVFAEVAIDEDANADPPPAVTACSGSGTVASGTNPAAGTSLATTTTPLAWVETVVGSTTYRWAATAINDTTRKEPRVLEIGPISRGLSDGLGGFEAASVTVRLSDYDRLLRGLMSSGVLIDQPFSVYAADAAALSSPQRMFYGVIRAFRPVSRLEFEIQAEDPLTFGTSATAGEVKVPARLITSTISDQNPVDKVIGKPVPLLYGSLSDEDQSVPIGVVPCTYLGASSDNPDADNLHRFLLAGHALKNVQAVYLADYVGGGVEPTVRIKAPASAYGSGAPLVSVPFQSGAYANYQDVAGLRYSFIWGLDGHLAIELARNGRIPMLANVCGAESTGDGTGTMLSNPARCFLHALNNRVAQEASTTWLSIKSLGSYSLFDTTTFEAAATICAARSYLCAGIVGADFQQATWRQLGATFCSSFDFDWGINRHGQVILAMLDRTSAYSSATAFTDQDHIIDGSFEIDPNTDEVENEVQYVYERNYAEALHAVATAEGSRPNRDPYDGKWWSGLQTTADETVITEMGGRPIGLRQSRLLELSMVRDSSTADDVADQRLARLKRPRATARFKVTLKVADAVELGDVVKVTHYEGVGSSGWSARRCQVRRIVVDLSDFTATLTVRDVENLLP